MTLAEVLALLAYVFGGSGLVGLAGYALVRLDRRAGRRPHRVDKAVQNRALPPAWGTWEAALERVPASVRADFLPVPTLGELLSDDGWPASGTLLVPDDVEVTDLAVGASVLRVPRAAVGHIRFAQGGPIAPVGQPPGWRRGRRRGEPAWVPLIPVRSSIPPPPPRGGGGVAQALPRARPAQGPLRGPVGGSGEARAVPAGSPKPTTTLAAVLAATARVDARRIADEARQLVPRGTGRWRSPHRLP